MPFRAARQALFQLHSHCERVARSDCPQFFAALADEAACGCPLRRGRRTDKDFLKRKFRHGRTATDAERQQVQNGSNRIEVRVSSGGIDDSSRSGLRKEGDGGLRPRKANCDFYLFTVADINIALEFSSTKFDAPGRRIFCRRQKTEFRIQETE